jgi:hypothetical protein
LLTVVPEEVRGFARVTALFTGLLVAGAAVATYALSAVLGWSVLVLTTTQPAAEDVLDGTLWFLIAASVYEVGRIGLAHTLLLATLQGVGAPVDPSVAVELFTQLPDSRWGGWPSTWLHLNESLF